MRLNLGRGSDPAKWEEAGWVEAVFDQEAAARSGEIAVQEVRISLPGVMTPTRLQRFPWARCLRVVEAVVRNPGPIYPEVGTNQRAARQKYHEDWGRVNAEINQTINEALHGIRPTAQRRPGRRGHDDDHYRKVADAYKALIAKGETAPNKWIAEDWGYSRNTVAGWVRKARQLGFLAPARKGRAG